VVLVVIDPISSYFGKGPDSHKNVDVRGVLEPVSEMAERLGVAVLSITHFSKAGTGTASKALHKFIGSIAFVAAPRIAFVVMEDPEDSDRRFFLHAKNNIAPAPPGLAYRLEQVTVGDQNIAASRVEWETGSVSMTADEAVAASRKAEAPQLEEAKQFLQSILATGLTAVEDIHKEAKSAGLSWDTVKRAKAALGLKSAKEGMTGGWKWKSG
jgi:putative DNA primase/helicase